MNIIDATYFPLDGTTTTTTVISTLQNKIIDFPFSDDANRKILDLSTEIADRFARIIETYLEVKDTNDDDLFADSILGSMNDFTASLRKAVVTHLQNKEISFGLIMIWVPLTYMIARSAKVYNTNPLSVASQYLQLDVFKIAELIPRTTK